MTLQYNANGHLIWHLCQSTNDPNHLDHLMAECCCDCVPAIRKTYTITWTQNAVAPSSQDFFWSDYYGSNRCQIFADSSPFEVTYWSWREYVGECTWRSPNFHKNPSPTRWTHLLLVWYSLISEWLLYVNGSSAMSDTSETTCNDKQLVFRGSPHKENRCDPRGNYVIFNSFGNKVETENASGPGNVELDISLVIS